MIDDSKIIVNDWRVRIASDYNLKRFISDIERLDVALKINITLFDVSNGRKFLSEEISSKNLSKVKEIIAPFHKNSGKTVYKKIPKK